MAKLGRIRQRTPSPAGPKEGGVMIHMGDFSNDDWLTLIEDPGPDGLGRVLGFLVFQTREEADRISRGEACEACDLFKGEPIPGDVDLETLSCGGFKASYGNR